MAKKMSNFQAAKTIVKQAIKVRRLKKKIGQRQALNRALRGGAVAGLSGKAAGAAASGGLDFNGGVSRPKSRKFR